MKLLGETDTRPLLRVNFIHRFWLGYSGFVIIGYWEFFSLPKCVTQSGGTVNASMIKVIRSQHRLNVVAINRSPRDLATHSSDTQTFEGYKIHLSDRVCDTFNHRVSWVIELSLSKPQNYMLAVNKIWAVYIVTITNYQNSVFFLNFDTNLLSQEFDYYANMSN